MGDAGKMGVIGVGSDGQVVKTGTEQPVNSFLVVVVIAHSPPTSLPVHSFFTHL